MNQRLFECIFPLFKNTNCRKREKKQIENNSKAQFYCYVLIYCGVLSIIHLQNFPKIIKFQLLNFFVSYSFLSPLRKLQCTIFLDFAHKTALNRILTFLVSKSVKWSKLVHNFIFAQVKKIFMHRSNIFHRSLHEIRTSS